MMMAVRYRRSVTLLEAEIADEIVALDESRGLCFGLSSVASDVWRSLEEPRTQDELVAALLDLYEIDEAVARQDLPALLAQLEEEGLIKSEPA